MTDRLGVLSSTGYVVEQARYVHINEERLRAICAEVEGAVDVPTWNRELHWAGDPEQTAMYVVVLDTLNFCFWGEPHWQIEYKGHLLDGYWALAAALRRAIEEGIPLLEASYLAEISEADLGHILRGTTIIPLFAQRLANLRELGHVLLDKYSGYCARLIESAKGDAVALVQRVAAELPSFNDVAVYDGRPVYFYKRAQLLVGDLAGSLNGQGLGALGNLNELTAFADYKLPQILRHYGILIYEPALAARIAAREVLPAGGEQEVEIRAHTVWAVELMRRQLERLGRGYATYQLDWWLWESSQRLSGQMEPYHRTRTIFY